MSRARHISSVSKEADRGSSDFSLFLYQSFLEGQAWSWYHPHQTCSGVLTAKIWQIHHVLHVKPWKMSLLFTKQPQSHNRVSTETFFSPGRSKRVTVFWIRPDITVYNSLGELRPQNLLHVFSAALSSPTRNYPMLAGKFHNTGHCPWGNQETSACLKAWSRGHMTRPDRFRTQQQ